MTGKTLVVGASTNPSRYSYIATQRLLAHNYNIELIGVKRGDINGKSILNILKKPSLSDIHTITMYIGPKNQTEHIEYLLSLNPARIIFNPGTENPSFSALAQSRGIEVENACTLVMLSAGQYSISTT